MWYPDLRIWFIVWGDVHEQPPQDQAIATLTATGNQMEDFATRLEERLGALEAPSDQAITTLQGNTTYNAAN